MLQLHETLTKKKTAMSILELAKIQEGYCYTTDLETSLKSNSCNNYQDGLYYIINAEPVPAEEKLDQFPETDFNKSNPLFSITLNQDFFALLKNAVPFTEKKDYMRPALMGVHFDHINQKIAATDGRVMFINDFALECPQSFTIPFESVEFIAKSIRAAKLKDFLTTAYFMPDGYVIFDFQLFEIKTRLIKQNFPDYLGLAQFQTKFSRQFFFDRKTLLSNLQTIKPFTTDSKKTVTIRTNINTNDLELHAYNEDKNIEKNIALESANLSAPGSIDTQNIRLLMPVTPKNPSFDNAFAVNREFFEKILKSSNAQTVILTYTAPKKAILINFE